MQKHCAMLRRHHHHFYAVFTGHRRIFFFAYPSNNRPRANATRFVCLGRTGTEELAIVSRKTGGVRGGLGGKVTKELEAVTTGEGGIKMRGKIFAAAAVAAAVVVIASAADGTVRVVANLGGDRTERAGINGGVLHPPRPSSSLSSLSSLPSGLLVPRARMTRPLVDDLDMLARLSASRALLALKVAAPWEVARSSLRISNKYDSRVSMYRFVCRCLELAQTEIESSLMI
jgi:hypothetical protein